MTGARAPCQGIDALLLSTDLFTGLLGGEPHRAGRGRRRKGRLVSQKRTCLGEGPQLDLRAVLGFILTFLLVQSAFLRVRCTCSP